MRVQTRVRRQPRLQVSHVDYTGFPLRLGSEVDNMLTILMDRLRAGAKIMMILSKKASCPLAWTRCWPGVGSDLEPSASTGMASTPTTIGMHGRSTLIVGATFAAMTTAPYRAPLAQTPPVGGRCVTAAWQATPSSLVWSLVGTSSHSATAAALCGSFVGTSSRTVLGSSMRGRSG